METYPGGEIVRYSYYKNGWLHTVTDTEGGVSTYTYDAGGRLVGKKDVRTGTGEKLTDYTYTYDEAGNIVSINGTETLEAVEGIGILESADMTYDADNRMLTYNGEALRYDADGNQTYGPLNGVMTEFTYDCRNRLVSAEDVVYTSDAGASCEISVADFP